MKSMVYVKTARSGRGGFLSLFLAAVVGLTGVGCSVSTTATKVESTNTPVAAPVAPAAPSIAAVPDIYKQNCAKCHGANGEGANNGKDKGPKLTDVTTRDDDKLSDADIVAIINNPVDFGLSSKMPSYEHKLTEEQKLEVVAWIKTLK